MTDGPLLGPALIGLGRVSSVAASPCGKWIAAAVQRLDAKNKAGYVSDLWRVPTSPDEQPTRLTHGEHNDRAPCFRHDGALGFLSSRPAPADDKDSKRSQVWVLPTTGGEPAVLTDEPLGVSDFKFAARADRLIVLAPVLPDVAHDDQRKTADDRSKHGSSALRYSELPVRFWDHWMPRAASHVIACDAQGDGRRDLTPQALHEYHDHGWDLSRDGRTLAITAMVRLGSDRVPDTYVHAIETATGEIATLGGEDNVWCASPRVSPDGREVAVQRSVRSPHEHGDRDLMVYPAGGGPGRVLVGDWDRWPVPALWVDEGLLCVVDDEGTTPVVCIDPSSGELLCRVTAVAAGGSHTGLAWAPDGFVGVRSTLRHPPEVFASPIAASEPRIVHRLSGFDPSLSDGLRVHQVTTREPGSGVDVQAWVVEPDDDEVRPGLVWIHGGPVSAWSDTWHWRWNSLIPASWGYRVIMPNPSGSTGFGRDLVEAIWGNAWGGQCYADVMAVTDAFAARPDVDAGRLAAMGGSFGGYMTNWIGANTDRFAALVTHASIYDLSAFHGVTDFPAFWVVEMGGIDPWRDADTFAKYSPREGVANWTSPTLIIHGEKDYRCPVGEGLALFEGLRAHGVEAELLVFPDENHWILKPRNVVAWYQSVRDWLDAHTQGAGEGGA